MTQPHLLELSEQVELAKQGDPHAIATLMNVTLEPQGVTAKASIEGDCLRVFLSAARPLNAKALVAFVQRGILRLEVSSLQQVQVYGQRPDDEAPAWVETFVVRSPTAEALALETLSNTSRSHTSRSDASKPVSVAQVLHDRATQPGTWLQQWMTQKPSIQVHVQASLSKAVATAKQMVARRSWHDRPLHDRPFKTVFNEDSSNAPTNNRSVSYLQLSALVTLMAFVTGGAVALIANSYPLGGAEPKTGGKPTTIAAGSQMAMKLKAEHTRDEQQTAARRYLETMNKAQQAFYGQNNRFAATLEELERFAAAPIAIRSDYIYKLTLPNSAQAQLTAVPKVDGLKSYTAAAAIAKPTNRVITAICASQQAAKVPPLVFQSTNGTVQCPAEPAKAS